MFGPRPGTRRTVDRAIHELSKAVPEALVSFGTAWMIGILEPMSRSAAVLEMLDSMLCLGTLFPRWKTDGRCAEGWIGVKN